MNRHMRNSLLAALLLLCGPAAQAEDADRNKPIHIEADRLSVDDANQVSNFDGHVQMTQGTLLVHADHIVITQDKDGYKHCTATGHVASFRQKREGLNEFVEGYGEKIVYDTRADVVDFYDQARVKRDQDDVRGQHITYNTRTEIFQVNGKPNASPDEPSQGRVHAVLQPKNSEEPTPPKKEGLSIRPSTKLTEPNR